MEVRWGFPEIVYRSIVKHLGFLGLTERVRIYASTPTGKIRILSNIVQYPRFVPLQIARQAISGKSGYQVLLRRLLAKVFDLDG